MLIISSVDYSHVGEYTCRASNPAGSVTHSANLVVNGNSEIFFDDNINILRQNDPVGERLAKIAKEKGMLLMVCDQCAVRRNLAEGTFEMCGSGDVKAKGLVDGVQAGCFPQLYTALGSNPPDQVITL